MRLITFNVNSLKIRDGVVRDLLATHQPDVMVVQEIKSETLPDNLMQDCGYTQNYVGQKAYNGVATLSRAPARVVMTGLPGMDDDPQARFLVTEHAPVRSGAGATPLWVANIYAPNGNPVESDKYAYKLRWLRELYDWMVNLRALSRDVVIAGDFNIIPNIDDAARPDDWRGDALFRDEVQGLYRAMLYAGYTDCLVAAGARDYTFWDYQNGAWPRNNGIRIDHVLATPRMADCLSSAQVDRGPRGGERPSDHTPVVVEFV